MTGAAAPVVYERLVRALERAQDLLKLAGAPEPNVRFGPLERSARQIVVVNKLFFEAQGISPISFTTEVPPASGSPREDGYDLLDIP